MLQKIQRFGGAMFTPVLLLAFAGIMVGLTTLLVNPEIMGSLANQDTLWFQIINVIKEGSWAIFRQIPLIFVVALPIGLAKKQPGRASLEALLTYLTFNYFLAAILNTWGSTVGIDYTVDVANGTGLAMIANIKTLDMGMMGALLISGITVYIHDKFFDKKLPEFLGVFNGSSFVVIIAFLVVLPLAFLCAFIWPQVQSFIASAQNFFIVSGPIGVWVYTFLERLLVPFGLHHFISTPFMMDSAIVEGGINSYWALHLNDFSNNTKSLIEMFPEGGFALYGMTKVFAPLGIAAAFYTTAKESNKKKVLGLLIPIVLTAIIAGITEPIEFTFLFISPILFVVHAFIAATTAATAYTLGVTGNFSTGLLNWLALNWLPLGKYHYQTYIIQVVVGLTFTIIWFIVFRWLIVKMNLKTPGREDDSEETKFYSKADYKEKTKKAKSPIREQATNFLQVIGGKENVVSVTNCATRLRITVKDSSLVQNPNEFKKYGAHGLVVNGNAIQIIIGLSVPHVRDEFEQLLNQ